MTARAFRGAGRASAGDRFVFHHVSSALWEIDISSLRRLAARWKRAGVRDLPAYLRRRPAELEIALGAMQLIDANEAAAALYEAARPADLVSPWDPRQDEESLPACAQIVDAAVQGRDGARITCRARTVGGRTFAAVLRLHFLRASGTPRAMLVETSLADGGGRDEVARAIIDAIPDQIFAKGLDGRYLIGNRTLAAWAGEPGPEALVGKGDLDYFPREIAEKFRADDAQVIASGTPRPNIEEEIRSSGGESRWALTTKVPLRDPRGRVIGVIGIVRDVTDRRALEEKLDDERRRMRTLIDSLPDCVFMKDREGRFLLVNRELAVVMGASSPEALIGRTDRDFYPPERAAEFEREERRIFQEGRTLVNEAEPWTVGAGVRWLAVTKVPLRDRDGAVIGLVGISRDITRRRQAEERNILLASMVEHSHDAIIGIDLEDRVTSWNGGAETVFGYTAAEMEGRPITALVSPAGGAKIHSAIASPPQQGQVQQLESEVTRKDGREVIVSSTISLIEDSRGRIIGTTLISRDITEQRALRAQVIRAQRLESLATLAAGIAHQFNNINAAVRGYLDVIIGEQGVPGSVRSWTREALKGVERSVEITERLQSFSSAAHAHQEAIDLAEIVPTILPLFDAVAAEQGVQVRTELAPVTVRASRSTLGFVITSVVNNSLHALREQPCREILLQSRTAGRFGVLEVTDSGCGISAENLPRVFTPFFTTKGEWAEPGSPQAGVRGVGLSLSVCQSTVAEQGGWIEVESPHGKGATVRVWLPAPDEGSG